MAEYFVDSSGYVKVVGDDATISATTVEFMAIEPTYSGPPVGYNFLFWSPETAYMSDGRSQVGTTFNASGYIEKIDVYTEALEALRWEAQGETIDVEDTENNVIVTEGDSLL